ncbi:MAG: HAMP domain-containing histidine kinase [Cyclobacteriaceae bacterium]|nr:HAMP domain-containing histidine kinase [Cyclobacteriaceae bacterium]
MRYILPRVFYERLTGGVFDMFHRSQNRVRGTGLGLYIVKTSFEKIGGEISVKTKIRKGSIFTVTFPYTYDEPSE